MKSDILAAPKSVLLVGASDAGKSNYLYRFWLACHSRSGQLRADNLPEEMQYLQDGVAYLNEGRFAPKTTIGSHNLVTIPVTGTVEQQDFRGVLVVPDCYGEEWMDIYRKREWSNKWEDMLHDSAGCLVFLRVDSDQNVAPLDWMTCAKYYGSAENIPDVDGTEDVPTQVVLVEWLQFLQAAFSGPHQQHRRPRFGIVITAWDLVPVEQTESGPHAYLEANYPLLAQFIETNCEDYDIGVFGVSIVGGDLDREPEFRKSFKAGNPDESGYVVHSLLGTPQRSLDLTLPVAWALGLDCIPLMGEIQS